MKRQVEKVSVFLQKYRCQKFLIRDVSVEFASVPPTALIYIMNILRNKIERICPLFYPSII